MEGTALRIIAGSARGLNIDTIDGLDTRPTLDRVREAVFGSIQFDIPGAAVLDLFSGSGAMGLEAASRGAASVFLNDLSPKCVSVIRQNAAKCGLLDKVTICQQDWRELLAGLAKRGMQFDIVFLDAPYASGFSHKAAEMIVSTGLLQDKGRIFLEHHTEDRTNQDIPGVMRVVRTKKYGKCSITELMKDI